MNNFKFLKMVKYYTLSLNGGQSLQLFLVTHGCLEKHRLYLSLNLTKTSVKVLAGEFKGTASWLSY